MRKDSNEVKRHGSRRRWPWVMLGCLAFVVLLVGLAPRVASSGPVRHTLLARLNARLAPATLSVDDWSLRWVGPIAITGLHFTDPDQDVDTQVAKLGASNGLAAMLPMGKLNLGTITVTAPHVSVRLPPKTPEGKPLPSPNQAPTGGTASGVNAFAA